ncbi:Protein CBG17119 [Caenorhabditis briggsae]|uniref:Protein CBG17119 n=1 Tax=Caenorhabditis briggsae TaxID=6238 RepID=A8XQQ1_CAEBR|nr:Protein CBG17119 [Caenorhabditis briggsae]CAP34976.2 Protein CBG17119 [Caenorhabditis briggsae]
MPNRRVARQRKNATSHQGTSKGINLKRRRLCDSSESESKQDAQDVVEETDNEQAEEPIQETIPKPGGTKNGEMFFATSVV